MRDTTTMNAMRSGLVVVGALAFGYLTLQLGFRPFLEKSAQEALHKSAPDSVQPNDEDFDIAHRILDSPPDQDFSNRTS